MIRPPIRRSARLAALALATGLAVAACGSSEPNTSESASSDSVSSDSADAASEPAGILDFEADLVGGGTLDASTLADRPTAFWFWAPT